MLTGYRKKKARPFTSARSLLPTSRLRRKTLQSLVNLNIILSPVGPYYVGGVDATKIYVEDTTGATDGGTGEAKCGGNYAASLKAQEEAHAKGYEQILWLDGRTEISRKREHPMLFRNR